MIQVPKERELRAVLHPAADFVLLLLRRLKDVPRNLRQACVLGLDLISIPLALAAGLWLKTGAIRPPALVDYAVLSVTVLSSAVIFLRLGLYRAIIRFMGHEAVLAVVRGVTLSALVLALAMGLSGAPFVLSLPIIYWAFMLVFVGGTRLGLRSVSRSIRKGGSRRVAIYGAGSAGRQLLSALQHGDQYAPVIFIDDNALLRGRVISDVPIVSFNDLPAIIERHELSEVFLAMASLGQKRRREIIRLLSDFPVQVRSIPSFEDLMSGRASIGQMQDVSLDDLLGREPVPPRPELVGQCIRGKTVLVTGAGGSIGSELCRQILANSPAELLLLDSSEYALYEIEKELGEQVLSAGCRTRLVPLLASIQDEGRMRRVMAQFRVQTVYHAAASKHVPIVEYNVIEGVRNNVFGTLNLARAAIATGVETFVLVSTDKAVRPANTMGATKRVSEMMMQALAAERIGPRFEVVRFGNVIGSSGSVVPLFREQIARGGPVTVTHLDAERFFMTVAEAAQLVLQAGAMGGGGDVFVLDMGQPVRIADLARRMIHLSGLDVREAASPLGDIEVRVIGLRPGEKVREELVTNGEISATAHPMIMRALEDFLPWPELESNLQQLAAACENYDCHRISEVFALFLPGFAPRQVSLDPLDAGRVATPSAKIAHLTQFQRNRGPGD